MPYASVSDLPKSVRDSLPAHGQSIFLSAFNSAFHGTCKGDEQCTNAIAWSAVKQVYEKNEKGEWVRKAQSDNTIPFDNLAEFAGLHDITLQRLETRIPHPDHPEGLYYSTDNFSGTEPSWESRNLVVFVPPGKKVEHLNHVAFANDPQGEVARLGYRIAGRLNNTRTLSEGPGEPRIISQVALDDTEAAEFASKGKLGISSAFDAIITPDGKMSGKVVPNHVLLFLRCAQKSDGFCGIPNDKGAIFNNLSEESMAEDPEVKGMFKSILEHVTPKENPLKATVDNLNTEIAKRDVQIKELMDKVTALTADKQALDNLRAEEAVKAKDAEWVQVKNLHQPGLFHKEREAVERAAYEASPAKWLMAHIGNLQTAKAAPAQGAAAVGNLGGEEDETKPFDVGAARGKLDVKTGQFTGGQ